jgi:hypothetical protein
LGPACFGFFDLFCMLKYLHLHEIYWEWDPRLNTHFIYSS